jgi:hypothetical protein
MRREIRTYKLGNNIFMHGTKRSVLNFMPLPSEPVYELDYQSDLSVIGNTIRKCIESCGEGQKHPSRDEFKTINDTLIKKANQKNSKSFFPKVLSVPISEIDGTITIYPSENHGWKDGFKNSEHPNLELDYKIASDEDLGKALKQAFEWSIIV